MFVNFQCSKLLVIHYYHSSLFKGMNLRCMHTHSDKIMEVSGANVPIKLIWLYTFQIVVMSINIDIVFNKLHEVHYNAQTRLLMNF